MEPRQTKPRIPYRTDQSIEDKAWGSVAICSITLITTVYLSDMGYIPSFAAGFLIGTSLLALTISLYIVAGTR